MKSKLNVDDADEEEEEDEEESRELEKLVGELEIFVLLLNFELKSANLINTLYFQIKICCFQTQILL